jgi:hypothetical protein
MMARGDQRVDPPSASRGAFPVIVLLVLVVALAVVVTGGVRLWANRPGRAAPGAAPPADEPARDEPESRRRWPGSIVGPAEPPGPPGPAAVAAAAPQPPEPPENAIAPVEQPAPPPAVKRSDVSPEGLAAERSRIAMTELGPRLDGLVRSGELPPGPPPRWHSTADALRDELGRSMIANPGVRVSSLSCYQAGCSLSLDAANESANVQARGRLKMLLRGETPRAFPGDTFVSGLVTRPDGYLRTTVILYSTGKGDSLPQ